jgi:serine/threonine protein kinase
MSNKTLTCPQCGRTYAEPAERCSVDGAPLYGPEVMQRLGITLGNYKIHSILGEGGMGVVYQGEHVMLRRPVAIKILHDRFARREGSVDQFLHEARAASQIRHPNIVDVTDFGTAPDKSVYFVMEYLEGESLEDVLARDQRLDLFNAVNVVRQTAQALASAHDHGIVHLDLKPEHIYLISRPGRRRVVRRVGTDDSFVVEPEGDFDFVKLLDFGVARFTHNQAGSNARPGMVFGTPHYMSPEQARGRPVDGRSDIYSLGILFYEMLLGDVPFDGDSAQFILSSHVSQPVPPPLDNNVGVEIDENTNSAILTCLAKDPAERYQTMDELLAALQHCFTDRVFLRDAHRLPGALEAGIVPPPAPTRPEPEPEPEPPQPIRPKPKAAQRSKASSGMKRAASRSLTEDLSELLSAANSDATPTEATARATANTAASPDAAPSPDAVASPDAAASPNTPESPDASASPTTRVTVSREGAVQATADPAEQPEGSTSPGLGAVASEPSSTDDNTNRKRKATAPLASKSD